MKIHIDLDSFFVSAERTRDASLYHKPVAIGGRGDSYIFAQKSGHQSINLDNRGAFLGAFFQTYDPSQKDIEKFTDSDGRIRGILTTSSYEARKFGIKTGMTIREALLLCPQLIIKAPNMALYKELSHTLHDFLLQRIPLIEQASIDEFYGDLKGWIEDDEVPCFIDMLRHEIQRDLNLPVSIGAAFSKPIAKLATSSCKPFGCKTVLPYEHLDFVTNIPIEEFPGIGRAMQKKLQSYQINTLGKLLKSRGIVESWSPYSRALYKQVNGEDTHEVKPLHVRKSIGISRTFDAIIDRGEIRRRIIILSRHLSHAIMRLGALPTTYHVGIRYELSQHSSANITEYRLFNEFYFRELSLSLFYKADIYKNLKIIRLSISCSHFTCNSKRELSLIDFDADLSAHKLSQMIKILRDRYGLDILRFGSEISRK
ncbi:MAG: DNA polymerase IV [Campylobacterota bacterium]|nr:DNA polymerase IV [Campylobacterota bacterium]